MTIDTQRLDAEAREILKRNDRGGYTVPTAGLYPYQWNWDSAFAAWGFGQFDLPRAWDELHTLFSGQWPNGMVPHILFHADDEGYFPGPEVWGTEGKGPIRSSGISQPPVAASFAWRLWKQDPEAGRPHVEKLFDAMCDYHRWFMDWRAEDGAICITHPWESGRDNAPDWDGAMAAIDPQGVGEYKRRDTSHVDPAMRPTKYDYDRYIWLVQLGKRLGWDEAQLREQNPFRVADPTMTFLLMRACRDLGELADALSRDRAEIDGWVATLEQGARTLWNPDLGAYDARDVKTGRFAGCLSNASFLCWYGGIDDDRMLAQLDRLAGEVKYLVPSHAPGSSQFDARRYWRGPVWGIVNSLIALGLAEQGHGAHAERIRSATAQLIAEHGFAEYFNPMDGSAAGGGSFTWTAAIWLAWASPSAGQGGA